MPYLNTGIREQRVKNFIDQPLDDKHKLDRYIEITDNYEMSQLNVQAFKTLNMNVDANSIDAIKTYKGKNKSCTCYGFSHN